MLDDFRSYVEKVASAVAEGKTLLAVSGGVDSMVMLDLFRRAGYEIAVAHVDHHTRAGQSTADADWLVSYCNERNIHITVGDYHHTKGSFQTAARSFRLDYLEQVRRDVGCDYVATAHHQDDIVETMLLMLGRGAGLKGLTSMRPLSGHRFKSLLFADKSSILTYQRDHEIPYWQDSSNDEVAYQRNMLRHEVLPTMEAWRDDIKQQMLSTHANLLSDRLLLVDLVRQVGEDGVQTFGDKVIIDRHWLKSFTVSNQLLHYLTAQHGWTADQTSKMLVAKTGSIFKTSTHKCLVDRDRLLIRPVVDDRPVTNQTIVPQQLVTLGDTQIVNQGNLPVTIRQRLDGDVVLVHAGSKPLRRLLIDQKVDQWTKEEVLVVAGQDDSTVYPIYPYSLQALCKLPSWLDVSITKL